MIGDRNFDVFHAIFYIIPIFYHILNIFILGDGRCCKQSILFPIYYLHIRGAYVPIPSALMSWGAFDPGRFCPAANFKY